MGPRTDPDGVEVGVLHELVDFAGADVLEVGCGDGRMTWGYADEAASVLALDVEGEKIEQAVQATPDRLRARVSFLEADINQVELSPASYDVAILAHSL